MVAAVAARRPEVSAVGRSHSAHQMNGQVACVLLAHGAVVTRECISLALEAADSALLYKFAEDHHELLVEPLGWPLGRTPLHMACERGSQDLVSSTVSHMCSISVMCFTSVSGTIAY